MLSDPDSYQEKLFGIWNFKEIGILVLIRSYFPLSFQSFVVNPTTKGFSLPSGLGQ